MNLIDSSSTWWLRPRRPPVDDAYTAWFDAHSRCTHALRAWRAAAPDARAVAHRAYVAELQLEEAAAVELQRLHVLRAAELSEPR